MIVLPYHPDHLARVEVCAELSYLQPMIDDPQWRRQYYVPGLAQTFVADGEVIACCGVLPRAEGRGELWVVFDARIGVRRFVSVVWHLRRLVRLLLRGGFFRLEAHADAAFEPGARLLRAVGMELEGRARRYDGERDYLTFARTS